MHRSPSRSGAALFPLVLGLVMAGPAAAADLEAGKAKALSVCAACHGANGVSVSDSIPNLAGQRGGYLENQLRAWKDGSRKNPLMNAIGAQLGSDDIANLAAWFASLPGAGNAPKSDLLPALARTRVVFPEDYKTRYTRYTSIDIAATKRVQVFYANPVAVQAARAGQPMPDGAVLLAETYAARLDAEKKPVLGPDGRFVPEQLVAYIAMARDKGWGQDFPDMLRNDDWNYAVFTTAHQLRAGVNQAECLACHKPQDKTSYLFTADKLAAAVR